MLASDNRVLELIQETLCAGKSVQGHAAGAFDRKLAAYAAAGALSCHEAISTEDVLERLALGYYVMIREGDIRRDLQIILPVKDMVDLRRVTLVTDGSNPCLVVKQGYSKPGWYHVVSRGGASGRYSFQCGGVCV